MLDGEHIGMRAIARAQRVMRGELISLEEYTEMTGNSYERAFLVPALSDEALVYAVRHCLSNCRQVQGIPTTYDEALVAKWVPEILDRFEKRWSYG